MDINTTIMFVTPSPHVGMPKYVHANPIPITIIAKQKSLKQTIVKKFQNVWFVRMFWAKVVFDVGGNS